MVTVSEKISKKISKKISNIVPNKDTKKPAQEIQDENVDKIKKLADDIEFYRTAIEKSFSVSVLRRYLQEKYDIEAAMVRLAGGKTGLGQKVEYMLNAVENQDVERFAHYGNLYKKSIEKFKKKYDDYNEFFERMKNNKNVYDDLSEKKDGVIREYQRLLENMRTKKKGFRNDKKRSYEYQEVVDRIRTILNKDEDKNEKKILFKEILTRSDQDTYYKVLIEAAEYLDKSLSEVSVSEMETWKADVLRFNKAIEG